MDYNLDSMPADDLMALWDQTNSVRPIKFARELFPNRPKGYLQATRDIGNYAANKATAMQARVRGDIETAMMYENICSRIYKRLPDYARSW